jgi:hypothetical protein
MWSSGRPYCGTHVLCLWALLVSLSLLSATDAPGEGIQERAAGGASAADTQPMVLSLSQVRAFGLIKDASDFGIGQRGECNDKPDPSVTAYPAMRSAKPIYGTVWVAGDPERTNSGRCLRFAIDESGSTGKGYDLLILDLDQDLNLTNDRSLKRLQENPQGLLKYTSTKEDICFETVGIFLPFGDQGERPLDVLPRLTITGEGYRSFTLITTIAREGRMTLAGHRFDILLGHNYSLPGWFDRPDTALHLVPDGKPQMSVWWGGKQLNATHKIGDTFYQFSATPLGDKLTVRPYTGPLGVLQVGAGGRSLAKVEMRGSIRSAETAVAVGGEMDGGWPKAAQSCSVPVGDYLPSLMTVTYGRLQIEISDNYHSDGLPRDTRNRPKTYGMQVRQDRPYTLDFSHPPAVLFASPAANQRVKLGDELMVKAVMIDPALDVMIRGLTDTSRRQKRQYSAGSGGTRTDEEDLSLDPNVVITRANGEKVAQGTMPFG